MKFFTLIVLTTILSSQFSFAQETLPKQDSIKIKEALKIILSKKEVDCANYFERKTHVNSRDEEVILKFLKNKEGTVIFDQLTGTVKINGMSGYALNTSINAEFKLNSEYKEVNEITVEIIVSSEEAVNNGTIINPEISQVKKTFSLGKEICTVL